VWDFEYQPTRSYLYQLSTYCSLEELLQYPQAVEILTQAFPMLARVAQGPMGRIVSSSPRDLMDMPFVSITAEVLDQLDEKLKTIPV
jgi:hypothetical protein